MDTITVSLAKNPDLAALIADMQPGAGVLLYTSLKHKDGQTAQLTIEECDEHKEKKEEGETPAPAEEGAEDTPPAPAPEPASRGKRMASKLNTPSY